MPSLLVVHGTGVREPAYGELLAIVRDQVTAHHLPYTVEGCYWGEPLGAALHAGGISVPEYASARAIGQTPEDAEVTAWAMLLDDPLFELGILGLRTHEDAGFRPGAIPAGEALLHAFRSWKPSSELQQQLKEAGLGTVFEAAQNLVASHCEAALRGAGSSVDEERGVLARAVVAGMINATRQQGHFSPAYINAEMRDALVHRIVRELDGGERGLGGWVARQLGTLLLRTATNHAMRRRGSLTDAAYPKAGDILVYQSRGRSIREFVGSRVRESKATIVLAHSLGSIACLELLATQELPSIELLITVGSPAPFLYEIDALAEIRYGDQLPPHFPTWLNVYDRRDILSYVGGELFAGRVQDVEVDSELAFPACHSAYWMAQEVWDLIRDHQS